MTDPKTLTDERHRTHGDWREQSAISYNLKSVMRSSGGWDQLTTEQSEALDMIAVKISRIVAGNPNHDDHWDDIAGYAFLGKQKKS